MAEIGFSNVSSVSSDLILALTQKELTTKAIIAPSVTDLSARATKGKFRISCPDTGSLTAVAKAEGVASTYQALTYTADQLDLDEHKQVPVKLEDKARIQAEPNVEFDIAKRSASAIVRDIETSLYTELKNVSAAAPDHIIQYTGAGNIVITQTDILEARKLLNDQNVDLDDRFLLINPKQEKEMLLIADFVRADAYGNANGLKNGQFGTIYGMPVLISTTVTVNESMVYHRGHVAWAMQQGMKFEKQRADLSELSDEFSLSVLYGQKVLKSGLMGVLINSTGA